jgi:hypothetical protein
MSVLSLMALIGPEAHACGGFACNAGRPVLQNAERIVFGLEPERNEVEMHVQITYSGPAEDFSWIVPVPADPELAITSSAMFTRLAQATQPRFNLNLVDEGKCRDGRGIGLGMSQEMALAAPMADSTAESGGVEVVDQEVVGPYESVTLQASSTEGLLAWLEENGYDIPDTMEPALAPYVADDAYFVALKLQKNMDAGDLAPLALRYEAGKAMVPVQLTSISATPDMRMEAYVLSDTRAVPESYYHVQINEAAIDWWTAGSNYNDVITQAANEAGGHAFATDFYGPANDVNKFWDEASYDEDRVRGSSSLEEWVTTLQVAIRVPSPELFAALEEATGQPAGNGSLVWACPTCVSVSSFDEDAATDLLTQRVIEPMRNAQFLVDRFPMLTRMTSSLDAVEMTVDPIFVLNPDMGEQEVRKTHAADLIYKCRNGKIRSHAKRLLVLEDGREIELPSEDDVRAMGLTDFQFIEELGARKAQVIEQTGSSGMPVVIADYTSEMLDQLKAFNRLNGYGCSTSGSRALGALGLGVLALSLTRRARRSRA